MLFTRRNKQGQGQDACFTAGHGIQNEFGRDSGPTTSTRDPVSLDSNILTGIWEIKGDKNVRLA